MVTPFVSVFELFADQCQRKTLYVTGFCFIEVVNLERNRSQLAQTMGCAYTGSTILVAEQIMSVTEWEYGSKLINGTPTY